MTLIVSNKDVTKNFILYLKKKMLSHIATRIDFSKLIAYDEYFSSDEFRKISGKVVVDAKTTIILGMTNLVHKRYETTTHIFINPNINYPGTSLKVVDLCKIINFGNMSVDAYPIFTDTFNHFSKNINKYADRCIKELG